MRHGIEAEDGSHEGPHLVGDSATHPRGPRGGTLAAWLLLAGLAPAASSRLASAPHHGSLGRVQLPFSG